jgi:hypothetical protein
VTPHDAVEAFTRAELLLYRIGIIAAARTVGPATTVPTGVTDAARALLADEDRRLNPSRDQGSEAPADRKAPPDPVERAAELIKCSPQSIKLIRYLNRQAERKAHLDDIAVGLDNARKITVSRRRTTIRQRYNRARDLLEKQSAPVRLHIHNNVIELMIVTAWTEHATPM